MGRLTTIIVPAFNEPTDFEQRLNALRERLDERFGERYELIVVDDASTDQTRDVLRRMRRTHPRVVLEEHDHRAGFRGAVESGKRLSSGDEILVFPHGLREKPESPRNLIQLILRVKANLWKA